PISVSSYLFFSLPRPPPRPTLFPYTTLFRSLVARHPGAAEPEIVGARNIVCATGFFDSPNLLGVPGEDLPHVSHFFTEPHPYWRSEEHTSELQSRSDLVCRLLLEKKKT